MVGGTVDLVRCSFTGGSGGVMGNAVYCRGTLTARECVFRGNTRGSVVYVSGASEFINCRFLDNSLSSGSVLFAHGDTMRVTGCIFSGNHGSVMLGVAITNFATYMELSHCLFTGNSTDVPGPGAIFDSGLLTRISHCTFTGNRGQFGIIEHGVLSGSRMELANCIVWNGPDPFDVWPHTTTEIIVTHSNVQGGYVGEGNIDVDPCFVGAGYWDAKDTPDDPADDVWVAGDYHLKSQAGHWDAESSNWVPDEVTSGCIDAGDPNGPIDGEPFPNGGYVNLGAYGGTAEASRTHFGGPVCTTQIAGDINGDCKVDFRDLQIMALQWGTVIDTGSDGTGR
jgi:hypothetical protein